MRYRSYSRIYYGKVPGVVLNIENYQIEIHPEENVCYIVDKQSNENVDYFKYKKLNEAIQRIRFMLQLMLGEK